MVAEILWYTISHWHTSFLLTLAIEVPLFLALAGDEVPKWRIALAGALATCATHPLLWWVWRPAIDDYLTAAIGGELLVVVVESALFFALTRPTRWTQAVAASCVANGASWGVGLVIGALVR